MPGFRPVYGVGSGHHPHSHTYKLELTANQVEDQWVIAGPPSGGTAHTQVRGPGILWGPDSGAD